MKALAFAVFVLSVFSCGRVADGTRTALNKGGEMAGSAATEVIEGVATGVEKSWALNVQASEALRTRGLGIGKTSVETGAAGNDNRLIVYLTSETAFTDTIDAVAFDQDGIEMGRARAFVQLSPNGADYFELTFQDRTDLERKCRVDLR